MLKRKSVKIFSTALKLEIAQNPRELGLKNEKRLFLIHNQSLDNSLTLFFSCYALV